MKNWIGGIGAIVTHESALRILKPAEKELDARAQKMLSEFDFTSYGSTERFGFLWMKKREVKYFDERMPEEIKKAAVAGDWDKARNRVAKASGADHDGWGYVESKRWYRAWDDFSKVVGAFMRRNKVQDVIHGIECTWAPSINLTDEGFSELTALDSWAKAWHRRQEAEISADIKKEQEASNGR